MIEQRIAEMEKAAAEQTAASQLVLETVNNMIGPIRDAADKAIADVNAAIPAAVNKELYQHLWLDPENGDDSNSGVNGESAFKTQKALIDSIPVGGTVCVRGASDLVVDVNESIMSANKHIVLYLGDCTLNLNATITLQGGSLKNYYTFKQINQTIEFGFIHYSADIRVAVASLNPTDKAVCFFKQTYTSGSVSQPGSHHSNVLFQGAVSDSLTQYYVFAPQYYKASMLATTYNVTLGANVALFDPTYSTVQVGTKGVYLVGA